MDRVGTSRRTVLIVMCVGYFLVLLDVTIVNNALPSIGADLHASLAGLQWVVDGYTVALAALMLAGGTVGDRRGHKRLVLAGLGVLTLASLGCALATGVVMLSLFRVLQGMGSALMLPGTLAVITHAYPQPREQARAIGAWAGIGSSALVLGPVLGGVLTGLLGWRSIFLLTVVVGLAVLPVAAWAIRESTEPRARRLDAPGLVLGAALLATVTYAFIEVGHRGPGAVTAAAVVAAVVLAAAFVTVERRTAEPMLPVSLFRDGRFRTANLVAGAMNFGTVGVLFVFNLYLQEVLGWSALAAGLAVLPLYAPLAGLAPLGGRLTSRVGPRWPMVAGLAVAAVGLALLVPLGEHSGLPSMLPALLLWGAGLGLLTPAVVTAAVTAAPPDRAGLAAAMNNTSRQASQAIGIAAFGALAGTPGAASFLPGFRLAAGIAAAVYVVAALAALVVFAPGVAPQAPDQAQVRTNDG